MSTKDVIEEWEIWGHLRRYKYEWDFGHYIAALAIAPNGGWVAGCGDEMLTVFDMKRQRKVYSTEFELSVKVITFNNASTILAYGLNEVCFRDTATWEVIDELQLNKRVYNIKFSNDDTICYISADDDFIAYDVSAKKIKYHYETPNFVTSIRAFDILESPDKKLLAIGGRDYGMLVVDLAKLEKEGDTGVFKRPLHTFLEDDYPRVARFSPDQIMLAWGGHQKVLVMDLNSPGDVRELPIDPDKMKTRALGFSPDSRAVVYGGVDSRVLVVDLLSGQPIFIFPGFKEGVWAAAFAPDQKWVVAGSYNRRMSFCRLGNPHPPRSAFDAQFAKTAEVRLSATSDHLLTLDGKKGRLWKGHLGLDANWEQGAAAAGNGGGGAKTVVEGLELTPHLPAGANLKEATIALSRSGVYAAWLPGNSGEGLVLDTTKDEKVCEFHHGDQQCKFLLVSPQDTLVASDSDGVVYISDLKTGKLIYNENFGSQIFSGCFSGCERRMAVCTGSDVEVLNLAYSSKHKLTATTHFRAIHEDHAKDAAFCPQDHNVLATAGLDFTVRLWELHGCTEIATYACHSPLLSLAWSALTPGVLVTIEQHGTVALWDVQAEHGQGARVFVLQAADGLTEKVLAAQFCLLEPEKAHAANDPESYDHLVVITKRGVTALGVGLVLRGGPPPDAFLDTFALAPDYLARTLRKYPHLGVARHSATGQIAAEIIIDLDREDLMATCLSFCPESAYAHGALAVRRALNTGNKSMLLRLVWAVLAPDVSHKGREELMRLIQDILEKAPDVMAEVLKGTDLEFYRSGALKYAHVGATLSRPSADWGAGRLWAPESLEYRLRKALAAGDTEAAAAVQEELEAAGPGERAALGARLKAQRVPPINKIGCYRVPLPGLSAIAVLDAFCDADHLELFNNAHMQAVISCLWRNYFNRKFYCLFAFHFTLFVLNLVSALLSAHASVTTAGHVLSVILIASSAYNTLYELYQLKLQYKKNGDVWESLLDPWSWLDWTYYTTVWVAAVLNLTNTNGFRQLGAVNVVLSSIEVLFYMRGFKAIAFLISALKQSVADLGPFLVIVFALLLAFSAAFFSLYDKDADYEGVVSRGFGGSYLYNGVDRYLFNNFLALLGIVFQSDAFLASISPGLEMFLYTLFIMVTLIVLLNLIISILSGTYAEVALTAKAEGLRERASIILEMSTYLSRRREEWLATQFKWVHLLAPMATDEECPAEEDELDRKAAAYLELVARAQAAEDTFQEVAGEVQRHRATAGALAEALARKRRPARGKGGGGGEGAEEAARRFDPRHIGGLRKSTPISMVYESRRRSSLMMGKK